MNTHTGAQSIEVREVMPTSIVCCYKIREAK